MALWSANSLATCLVASQHASLRAPLACLPAVRSLSLVLALVGWAIAGSAFADDVPAEPDEDDYVTVSDEGEHSAEDSAAVDGSESASADEPPADTATSERLPRVRARNATVAAATESSESQAAEDDEKAIAEVAPVESPQTKPAPTSTTADADARYPHTDEGEAMAESAPPARMPKVQPATFRGVVAGETTRDELLAAWGDEAVRSTENGNELTYQYKPFKQVVVKLVNDKVDTVVIHLDELVQPDPLAKQLQLDDVLATHIYNAKGQKLGMAYPERGVLFAFAAEAPVRVAQVVLEPVNSQPFVTRAEERMYDHPADALADVEFAIEIDPQYDRAHAVHAKVLCQLGDFVAAKKAIEQAQALVPEEAEYQLILSQAILGQGDYAAALKAARQVGPSPLSAYLRAQAELVQGHALARQSEPNFAQALEHHTVAIKHAQQVAAASTGPIRRRMKELAIDAHLAVANDIARGNWQQKETIVPQWVDRAKAISEHIITKEGADEISRLWIYAGTLQAYAGLKSPPDVNETIDAMSNLGRRLLDTETHAGRRETLHYQLACALANGMVIAQARDNHSAALQLGQQSVKHFEQALPAAGKLDDYAPHLADAYYLLGSIHAIDQEEHTEAAAWYRQAVPLLLRQAEVANGQRAVRLGEMLVSVAITYWEIDDRDQAIELTERGAELIAAAVKAGHAKDDALVVPYGNMAAMHEALGSAVKAKQFSEMASRAGIRR